MQPVPSHRSTFLAPGSRWFAGARVAAAIAATTLAACGPHDETPLAGGAVAGATQSAPVPVMAAPALAPQTEVAHVGNPVPPQQTPVPAMAPVPSPAAPGYAPPSAVTVAQAAPDDPALRRATPVAQAPVIPRNRVGSIVAIDPIRTRPQGSGAGAVVGGVLGGVIGNQFGHGLGRAAMTGVGAAGGAIAGNNIERNYMEGVAGYRVHIRLDNGSTRTFERRNIGALHVGDRIRLDGNGFRRG